MTARAALLYTLAALGLYLGLAGVHRATHAAADWEAMQ